MGDRKRVAVVGAGLSGLCAVKSCLEEGLEPICFEQYDNLGGVWYFTEEYREGQGARMYDHLTTNISKDLFAYSDFPFPRETPVYLTCNHVFRYLNSYCDHFGLRKYIHLNTKVKKISKADDYDSTGNWTLDIEHPNEGRNRHTFEFVIVCAGYQKEPIYPDIPGKDTFRGTIEHSMTFKDAKKFQDKRVLVVGNGFSSCDVASFATAYADQVYLSVGKGVWVLPKTVAGGVPVDVVFFKRPIFRNMNTFNKMTMDFCNERLDHVNAGLCPSGLPTETRLVLHDDLQKQICCGKIKIVARVVRLGPGQAELDDGTVIEDLDSVVFGTGYKKKLDFLDEEAGCEKDRLPLYKLMFPVYLPKDSLALVGCYDTDGSFPVLAELQCRIVARVFAGLHSLPPRAVMAESEERLNKMVFDRFGRYRYLMPNMMFREQLAEELGVVPSWWQLLKAGPRLLYLYCYGTVFPYYYRMWGPHTWPGARQAIEDAEIYGHITVQPRKVLPQKHQPSRIVYKIAIGFGVLSTLVLFLQRAKSYHLP